MGVDAGGDLVNPFLCRNLGSEGAAGERGVSVTKAQYSVCVPVVPVQSAEIPAGYDEPLGFTYTIPDWGAGGVRKSVFCAAARRGQRW